MFHTVWSRELFTFCLRIYGYEHDSSMHFCVTLRMSDVDSLIRAYLQALSSTCSTHGTLRVRAVMSYHVTSNITRAKLYV